MNRHSTGRAGEYLALLYFDRMNWNMEKTEPNAKYLKGGKLIHGKSNGRFDYIGYDRDSGKYVAVEVKECAEDTMPASRLSKEQMEWAEQKPNHCFVLIDWKHRGMMKLYRPIPKRSYRFDEEYPPFQTWKYQ